MKQIIRFTFLLAIAGFAVASAAGWEHEFYGKNGGPTADDQPVELGTVRWNRDLDDAKRMAAKSGKPIFVLFQEVPG